MAFKLWSRILGKSDTFRSDSRFNRWLYSFLGTGSVIYNPESDEQYITQGYQRNPTVYSIIQLITKHATKVPYQVYEVKNSDTLKQYKSMTSGSFDANVLLNARILKDRTFTAIENDEINKVLDRPNPGQGYQSFMTNLIAFGKLTGDRYIYGIGPKTGENRGKKTELHVLPSQLMEIVAGGTMEPVRGYKINWNPSQEIDSESICHIKDFNPEYTSTGSQLYGQSPIKAAFRSLETNNVAIDTGKSMLTNQASRGLLVSKEDNGINETQGKALDEKLKEKMKQGRGGLAITGKPMEYINFGLSVTDLALIEQYNMGKKDLCEVYNVPPGLIGVGTATYENQKEWKKALYENAIIPELCKIRDELNRWWVPAFGENLYLDFDFTSIPELQDDMNKVVAQLSSAWWVTGNEKRVAMNYPIDEENELMSDYLLPQGLMPSTDLALNGLLLPNNDTE